MEKALAGTGEAGSYLRSWRIVTASLIRPRLMRWLASALEFGGGVCFQDRDSLLGPAGLGEKVGDGPGRVPGVALRVCPCLLDSFVEQAAVSHEPKPYPEELPLLLAVMSRLEDVEVGQAVPGAAMVGVQGAQCVDDPVVCAAGRVRERTHHLDRLVVPAMPGQELRQLARTAVLTGR